MEINILPLLKSSPLFASLDEGTLKKLLRKFKKLELASGETLFQQGEPADGIFFLVKGSIGLYLEEEIWLLMIKPGETIGELSALSGEPRSVNAKALEDSTLLLLPGEHFREFCQQYPVIALSTIHFLVGRSNKLIQLFSKKKKEPRRVAIVPANPKVNLKKFTEQLLAHHQDLNHVAFLSDYDPEFRRRYRTFSELATIMDNVEKEQDLMICLLESSDTLLAKISFERNSQIYIVAHSDSEPDIHPLLQEKIQAQSQCAHLILLQDRDHVPMPPTAKWLALAHFDLHHNIKPHQKNDQQRLLRFMGGQANGVVLGGGGLRSWAHIGALEAIVEAGIPIDMIGGTSAGAIVAAHYILHGPDKGAEMGLRDLSELARKIISVKNLSWPTLSLFNTKPYLKKQRALFDGILIEDMPLPCFIVACNLSKNKEVIYRKGPLWEAIESSTAVPAIFPPRPVNGELEVDGGILNNLPVDIMKRFLGPQGKVIAVELTRYDQDPQKYFFPPNLNTWDAWMSKLGLSKKHYKLPSFVDVFLSALLAGAAYKQEENGRQAEILVQPNLSQFGLMNVSLEQENALIRIGKKSTREGIETSFYSASILLDQPCAVRDDPS